MKKYWGCGLEQSAPTIKVMLAIAAYEGVSAGCAISLYESAAALQQAGIEHQLLVFSENCSVNDARNEMVAEFLQTDCTDLIFIDADVRFGPECLLNLLSYDRDIVAGIYPKKGDNTEYPVQLPPGEMWTEEDGCLEVLGAPTGFLRIRRNVFEHLCEFVPHVKTPDPRLRMPLIFERSTIDFHRLTGDFEFCRKWRSLGGKIHVDPEMHLGHGGKAEWTGSLGKHLRQKNGIPEDA